MNRINPVKLFMSKWTAVNPELKERHFIVTGLIRAEDETIVACVLEAVINNKSREIDWHELKDSAKWMMGWN